MSSNKKYYYLKLKENFFDSEEMIILQSMQDGYIYSDILMKLYLRSLKNEGKLMFKDVIPYTPDVLATVVRHQVGTVEKALQIFKQLGLIEVLDNGAIYMMDIQNFIGESSTEADRKRQYRARIENEKVGRIPELSETGHLSRQMSRQMSSKCPDKSPPEIEIEIEKEIEIDKEIKKEIDKEIKKEIDKEIEKERKKERKKEQPPKSKNKTFDEIIDSYTDNEALRTELKEHLKTRKAKKATLTNRAIELSLNKLDKISSNETEKIQIVQNAIMNGWTTFYPLKEEYKSKQEKPESPYANYRLGTYV